MERITDTLQVINLACCLFIPYFWSLTSSQRSFSDFSYSIPLSPLKKATLDMVSSLPIYKHHSCYWHLVVCDRDPLYRELLATVLLLLWQLHFLPFWYPLKIPLFIHKNKIFLDFYTFQLWVHFNLLLLSLKTCLLVYLDPDLDGMADYAWTNESIHFSLSLMH